VLFFDAAGAFLAGAFFVGVFFVETAALVLVTRPDLVLLRTAKSSFGTAGAGLGSAALRGLLALALGFAAAVFLAAGLVSFFGAALVVFLVAVAGALACGC
jgi:hypothetical protein